MVTYGTELTRKADGLMYGSARVGCCAGGGGGGGPPPPPPPPRGKEYFTPEY